MNDYSLAITILKRSIEGAKSDLGKIEEQIAPLEDARRKRQADLAQLQGAVELLEETDAEQEPGTEYSPADGEQRLPAGTRARVAHPAHSRYGQLGTIEDLGQAGDFYTVRFDDGAAFTLTRPKLEAIGDSPADGEQRLPRGTRVRVARLNHSRNGQTGTIVNLGLEGGTYTVRFADGLTSTFTRPNLMAISMPGEPA